MTCQGCADTNQEGLSSDPNINSASVVLKNNELSRLQRKWLVDRIITKIISKFKN